ncbi:MAG: hypothetical protein ACP5VF_11580 [Acidobacteriota bacterium]
MTCKATNGGGGRRGLRGWTGRLLGLALMLVAASAATRGAQPAKPAAGIDLTLAAKVFQEAKALSDADGGRMWGTPLYGSMLFVDEATREVVANRPDYKNLLKAEGSVFVGTLPPEENIANTAMRWAGVDWTMVRWPLPQNRLQRDVLLMHESFHRIQEKLGLSGPDTACDALDTRDGRLWLQLEWRALQAALVGPKQSRRRAVEDALLFRAYRRSLFPGEAADEQALEMHEGIPEYVGIALSARSRAEAEAYAAAGLQGAPSYPSFIRSFAYVTGPAYGLLLDGAKPGWQRALKPKDDLSALLAQADGIALPADLKAAAEARAKAYGGAQLAAEEDKRAQQKIQEVKDLHARFVEGPVLTLPAASYFTYSFDPTNPVPLEGLGTVYPYLRVSAAWGILEAKHGALLLQKEGFVNGVRVPAPKDVKARPLKGDGWTLTLNDGWAVVPDTRKGDYKLIHAALPLP